MGNFHKGVQQHLKNIHNHGDTPINVFIYHTFDMHIFRRPHTLTLGKVLE